MYTIYIALYRLNNSKRCHILPMYSIDFEQFNSTPLKLISLFSLCEKTLII